MRTTLLLLFSAFFVSKGFSQTRLTIAEGAKSAIFMQDSAGAPNGESTPTFIHWGNKVYFANNGVICLAKKVGDRWTKPIPISFAGQYKDWDPTLTPDGKRLLFVSNRVYVASDGSTKTGNHNYGPSISASGTICFCSRDRDGNKGMRAYL